jgi:hypothetical protein
MKKALSLLRNKTVLNAVFFLGTLGLLFIYLPVIESLSFSSLTKSNAHAIAIDCAKAEDKEVCFTEHFSEIAAKNELAYTLSVLEHLQATEARSNGCHFIGHVVGEEEVKKDPGRWEETIAKLPVTQCTGGFLMGALEAHKELDKTFVLNAQTIPVICNRVLNHTQQLGSDQTCIHTTGHLLLIEKLGAVPKAIDECSQLQSFFIYECSSGVFMENIYRRNLHDHGIGLPLEWNAMTMEQQQRLCLEYIAVQGQACWRELSHMFVDMAERDAEKVYMMCNNAPEQNFIDSCYLHAVHVMVLTEKNSSFAIEKACAKFEDTDYREQCLEADTNALSEIQ